MRQIIAVVLFAAIALGAAAWAGDENARAKLSGAWQLGTDKGGPKWILNEKADAIHITYLEGDRKLAEFECNTMGRECDMRESGKSAKVSMWFSGSKLVELETKGKQVVKRRFAVAEQGNALDLEVIPIQPDGKTETMRLRRVER